MVSAKDYRKQDTKLAGPSQKALLPIYCLGPFRLNTGRNLGLNSCMPPLVLITFWVNAAKRVSYNFLLPLTFIYFYTFSNKGPERNSIFNVS